jgi:hypothetical protein
MLLGVVLLAEEHVLRGDEVVLERRAIDERPARR